MASITIRNIDEAPKARLRIRAAVNNRSMEDEVRDILRATLSGASRQSPDLAEAIRQRFAVLGGVDLPPVVREPMRTPPAFE